MSWQEKIERYQTEQRRKQEEVVRLEKEAKLRIAKEKIPPLLEALNKLPIREFLTQIKDDEWRLGEIEIAPKEINSDTPIRAEIKLVANWPRAFGGDWTKECGEGDSSYNPSGIGSQGERIVIGAEWGYPDIQGGSYSIPKAETPFDYNGRISVLEYRRHQKKIENGEIKQTILLNGDSRGWYLWSERFDGSFTGFSFNDPATISRIEKYLLEISIVRKKGEYPPPLTQYKSDGEAGAILAINEGLDWPIEDEDFKYLYDLAKKI